MITDPEAADRARRLIRSVQGPNRGLCLVDRENNLNPDPLHAAYLKKRGYEVLPDGRLKIPGVRGVQRGEVRRCPNCGKPGHYRKTCPEEKKERSK